MERPTKVADCAASNTQAEQKLLASELGTQILALRDEKEKAIRRESGGGGALDPRTLVNEGVVHWCTCTGLVSHSCLVTATGQCAMVTPSCARSSSRNQCDGDLCCTWSRKREPHTGLCIHKRLYTTHYTVQILY